MEKLVFFFCAASLTSRDGGGGEGGAPGFSLAGCRILGHSAAPGNRWLCFSRPVPV